MSLLATLSGPIYQHIHSYLKAEVLEELLLKTFLIARNLDSQSYYTHDWSCSWYSGRFECKPYITKNKENNSWGIKSKTTRIQNEELLANLSYLFKEP